MKKKTDEELGILLTREMQTMMFDKNLKAEQKVQIFCAVVGDEKIKDPVLASYANALKTGYVHSNSARIASIYARRERQKEYQRNIRASTEIDGDIRALPIKGNGKGKGNIPLPPKGGKGAPSAISPEDLMSGDSDPSVAADKIARDIIIWYPYAVTPRGLKKSILDAIKKSSARAVADGIDAWRESGAWDEKRFVPRRIAQWIKEGHYLDEPPQKKSLAARADGGRALAAPSADATMRMIESEGEEE